MTITDTDRLDFLNSSIFSTIYKSDADNNHHLQVVIKEKDGRLFEKCYTGSTAEEAIDVAIMKEREKNER